MKWLGNGTYELAQAGTACGVERDSLLTASDTAQPNGQPGFTRSPNLTSIGSLAASINLDLRYFETTSDCATAYGQYVYTLILQTNNHPENRDLEQTLFYQIQVGRSNYPGNDVPVVWCPEYEMPGSGRAFCLDDDVRNFGGYLVQYPGSGISSFDIIPRLREVIAAGHTKAQLSSVSLDTDPSHWFIGSIYVGGILQGKTNDSIRISDVHLNSYAGGTFDGGGQQVQFTCGNGQPPFAGWIDMHDGCYHRPTGKQF